MRRRRLLEERLGAAVGRERVAVREADGRDGERVARDPRRRRCRTGTGRAHRATPRTIGPVTAGRRGRRAGARARGRCRRARRRGGRAARGSRARRGPPPRRRPRRSRRPRTPPPRRARRAASAPSACAAPAHAPAAVRSHPAGAASARAAAAACSARVSRPARSSSAAVRPRHSSSTRSRRPSTASAERGVERVGRGLPLARRELGHAEVQERERAPGVVDRHGGALAIALARHEERRCVRAPATSDRARARSSAARAATSSSGPPSMPARRASARAGSPAPRQAPAAATREAPVGRGELRGRDDGLGRLAAEQEVEPLLGEHVDHAGHVPGLDDVRQRLAAVAVGGEPHAPSARAAAPTARAPRGAGARAAARRTAGGSGTSARGGRPASGRLPRGGGRASIRPPSSPSVSASASSPQICSATLVRSRKRRVSGVCSARTSPLR